MTFAEYQSQVLEDYQRKQAAGSLSFALPYPTPARIKAGCIEVLETRFEKADESFLRSYFKMGNSQDFGHAVRRYDTDKFRPLNSYLRDPLRNPSPEHIQLLAWLINFSDRPYKSSYELLYNQPERTATANGFGSATNAREDPLPGSDTVEDELPVVPKHEVERKVFADGPGQEEFGERINGTPNGVQTKSFLTKKALYSIGAVILFAVVVFYWSPIKPNRGPESRKVFPVLGQKGCVVWADDHYEPSPCKQSINALGSFGLEASTVRNLKRITRPDTITPKSLRKVWYVKIDDHLEYYTVAGFHPVHTERRLKPLTAYMFNKYLFHYSDKTKKQLGFLDRFIK